MTEESDKKVLTELWISFYSSVHELGECARDGTSRRQLEDVLTNLDSKLDQLKTILRKRARG